MKKEAQRRQRAVAIAKDIIAQVSAEAILPAYGNWISFRKLPDGPEFFNEFAEGNFLVAPVAYDVYEFLDLDSYKNPATDALKLKGSLTCCVCAVGAMVLSNARLYNKFTIDDLGKAFNSTRNRTLSNGQTLHEWLCEAFTTRDLVLIEAAFEGEARYALLCMDDDSLDSDLSEEIEEAEEFHTKALKLCRTNPYTQGWPSSRVMLLCIMHNVIANNGRFEPTQEPELEDADWLESETEARC